MAVYTFLVDYLVRGSFTHFLFKKYELWEMLFPLGLATHLSLLSESKICGGILTCHLIWPLQNPPEAC